MSMEELIEETEEIKSTREKLRRFEKDIDSHTFTYQINDKLLSSPTGSIHFTSNIVASCIAQYLYRDFSKLFEPGWTTVDNVRIKDDKIIVSYRLDKVSFESGLEFNHKIFDIIGDVDFSNGVSEFIANDIYRVFDKRTKQYTQILGNEDIVIGIFLVKPVGDEIFYSLIVSPNKDGSQVISHNGVIRNLKEGIVSIEWCGEEVDKCMRLKRSRVEEGYVSIFHELGTKNQITRAAVDWANTGVFNGLPKEYASIPWYDNGD
ncbi:MAG: hypothetical protein ACOC5T_00460 [Elusimicrobiota bacterium]